MTDWSKLKVADLKEECKARDIPLTGLKLKQQYIDKLEAFEAAQEDEDAKEPDAAQATSPEEAQPEAQVNGHTDSQQDPQPGDETDVARESGADQSAEPDTKHAIEKGVDEPMSDVNNTEPVSATGAPEDDKPAELQNEDSQGEVSGQTIGIEPVENPTDGDEAVPLPESMDLEEKVGTIKQTNIELPEQAQAEEATSDNHKGPDKIPASSDVVMSGSSEEIKNSSSQAVQLPSDTSTPASSQIPLAEVLEDRRQRRKRSLTPAPTMEETSRKKARLSDDATGSAEQQAAAIDQMREDTQLAKDIPGEAVKGISQELPAEDSTRQEKTDSETIRQSTRKDRSLSPASSQDEVEDRDVPPAIHPATSSIYIRNLKRPLHIPTLRSHIVSLARPRSSDQTTDPITVFFLDSIRTHAFISFTSISAASRVRSSMHETRFPDEPMREALFIDYVPDEKVQSWIDQETGGNSFGGRAGGRRFEVVYEERNDGEIEAIFQEADGRNPPSRPAMTSRASLDRGRLGSDAMPQGIHPDRVGLLPTGPRHDSERPAPPSGPRGSITAAAPPRQPSNAGGAGFKALDDLFSSTAAKPKLYFKPVHDDVVQSRLDLFQDLRVQHSEMGRSGDEGMKRYSLERQKGGREDWVDKGPEFGYGKIGKDRFAGYRGRGGGGGGGGGGYRGRGGDSWRGGR